MAAAYVLRRSSDAQFYFYLRADNNEPILTSERYVTRQAALNGIQSCRANSPYDKTYDRLRSSDQKYYFVLKAENGQVIGVSETYETMSGMETGIAACKKHGPTAPLDDQT